LRLVAGGLRIVDVADPQAPQKSVISSPSRLREKPAPQTNDVDVDSRGLIYNRRPLRRFHVLLKR